MEMLREHQMKATTAIIVVIVFITLALGSLAHGPESDNLGVRYIEAGQDDSIYLPGVSKNFPVPPPAIPTLIPPTGWDSCEINDSFVVCI